LIQESGGSDSGASLAFLPESNMEENATKNPSISEPGPTYRL